MTEKMKNIAVIGGGPSGLFMVKRLTEASDPNTRINIFEKSDRLGSGMPYSQKGASPEHITNVSGNEIPDFRQSLLDWMETVDEQTLRDFGIDRATFNDYKTLPRLLFGRYLQHQFELVLANAAKKSIQIDIHFQSEVTDIVDYPLENEVEIVVNSHSHLRFTHAVICTGHIWPTPNEKQYRGFFDSPYPPSKIQFPTNHPVALRGSSLTAIDAIRTLARQNGQFIDDNGVLNYLPDALSPDFKLVVHSRNGLWPAMRFHLEDSHLGKGAVLSDEEIESQRLKNEGFLPLDYVFERNFKDQLQKSDPLFYALIKDVTLEQFVETLMDYRQDRDAFNLLRDEYKEADRSIEKKQSVHWKEMLGVLSFAMNYPAKYFSAEDMLRLKKILSPLISVVIAYLPQASAREILALQEAGRLELLAVGEDARLSPHPEVGINYHYANENGTQQHFQTFIDCIGQPHLDFDQVPFESLKRRKTISRAMVAFRDQQLGEKRHKEHDDEVFRDINGQYYLLLPGVAINDNFQVIDQMNKPNERVYMMAVSLMGGFNPDYSGLDFCEAASAKIAEAITKH